MKVRPVQRVNVVTLGCSKNLDDSDTHASAMVRRILKKLRSTFRAHRIIPVDERFTSKMATRAMLDMGMKKSQRQNKALVDEIAATIMLQEYLSSLDAGI